jgi:hypothetical protein
VAQLEPFLPQALSWVPGWHCDGLWLSQQPGQDESQTHWPPTHVVPEPHIFPLHVHWPPWQSGAEVGHGAHEEWAAPHALLLSPVTQRFWLLQHVVHVPALQRQVAVVPVPEHTSPALHGGPEPHAHCPCALQRFAYVGSHAWHLAPSMPQASAPGGLLQVSCSVQQPPSHAVGLQWHAPFSHSCPAGHGAPLPHWQFPFGQPSEW